MTLSHIVSLGESNELKGDKSNILYLMQVYIYIYIYGYMDICIWIYAYIYILGLDEDCVLIIHREATVYNKMDVS